MNFLMILSHTAAGAHLHVEQIVPIAVVSVLVVAVIVLLGRRSLARK